MATVAAPGWSHAAEPGADGTLAPLMLVLDASGSMTARASAGTTRMAAAKQAVRTVLAQTPDDARVGLTVYGTRTGSGAAEKARGCRDVTVAHPVHRLDRGTLVKLTDGLRPRGYTPIGYALQVAAGQLPTAGPRSIVLVSDGVDTCAPPDPCQVARRLSQQDPDLRIHTIGFQVDAKARAQLLCIAQASGGTYAAAPDAADLGVALRRTTAQALRNYQPAGTPVRGTTDPDTAPDLAPGTYLDTLGTAERQYYAVPVAAGQTVHVSATTVYPRGLPGYQNLHMRLAGPDGADCLTGDDDVSSREGDAEPLTTALTWEGAATASGRVAGCTVPGRYTFEIWRNRDGGDPVPLELFVHAEAPVTGPSGPPAASRPVGFREPEGSPRTVTGGGSFGSAATLPGPGRYADTLQHGEYVFYRVAVDWGEGLAVRVRYDAGSRTVANIKAALYGPARQQIATATANYVGRVSTLPSGDAAFATLPVRYRNRESPDPVQHAQSMAGWYYLGVKLGRAQSIASTPVPVRLDVAVLGAAEPGPAYATAPLPQPATETAASSGQPAVDQGPASQPADRRLWTLGGLLVVAAAAAAVGVRRRARAGSRDAR